MIIKSLKLSLNYSIFYLLSKVTLLVLSLLRLSLSLLLLQIQNNVLCTNNNLLLFNCQINHKYQLLRHLTYY